MTQQLQTKACPYCAEDIKAQAVKCKHCGSELSDRPTTLGHDNVKVKQIPKNKDARNTAKAVPKMPGALAWAIALAPLAAGILSAFFPLLLSAALMIILSVLLCYVDERSLRRQEYVPPKVGLPLIGVLLGYYPALYLFLRARQSHQPQWPFAVWFTLLSVPAIPSLLRLLSL